MTIEPDTLIQALADGTRLRALVLLNRETSLCVCELTAALDVPQPKMSRHLAALRGLGIVEDARRQPRFLPARAGAAGMGARRPRSARGRLAQDRRPRGH